MKVMAVKIGVKKRKGHLGPFGPTLQNTVY